MLEFFYIDGNGRKKIAMAHLDNWEFLLKLGIHIETSKVLRHIVTHDVSFGRSRHAKPAPSPKLFTHTVQRTVIPECAGIHFILQSEVPLGAESLNICLT